MTHAAHGGRPGPGDRTDPDPGTAATHLDGLPARDGEAAWLELGERAGAALRGGRWGGRSRALEPLAEESGRSIQTLRRMATAADYAVREAAACGIGRGGIHAAASSVEALMRLEKASRLDASKVKAAILTGEIGYKPVLALLGSVKRSKAEAEVAGVLPVRESGAASATATASPGPAGAAGADPGFDIAAALAGAFTIAVASGAGPGAGSAQSQVGQILLVDVEFGDAGSGGTHAVFLSPAMGRSRQHGLALEDATARMVAACHAYDHVHFFTASRREADQVRDLTESWNRLGWIPLDILMLGGDGAGDGADAVADLASLEADEAF